MLHGEITEAIIGCAFDVINELGSGFLESVYESALMVEFAQKNIDAERQKAIAVNYKGKQIGHFVADILVEGKVIVELKNVSFLTKEHQAQAINYLKATGLKVALLINFGKPKLEYKRLTL